MPLPYIKSLKQTMEPVPALSIALQFVFAGGCWIVFSDMLLFFTQSAQEIHFSLFRIEVLKGMLFVVTMGAFIFVVIQREMSNRSQLHHHELFARNTIPMWIYDLQTMAVVDVNEEALKRYGYSKSEMMKLSFADVCADEEKFLSCMREIDSGVSHLGSWTHIDKQNKRFKVQLSATPILYANKKAVLVSAYDLSTQGRLEQELAELRLDHAKTQSESRNALILALKDLEVRYRESQNVNDELMKLNALLSQTNQRHVTELRTSIDLLQQQVMSLYADLDTIQWFHDVSSGKVILSKEAETQFGIQPAAACQPHFWRSALSSEEIVIVDQLMSKIELKKTIEVELSFQLTSGKKTGRLTVICSRNSRAEIARLDYKFTLLQA